jgi:glycosyltransferase involved in cell wall biosynthesis
MTHPTENPRARPTIVVVPCYNEARRFDAPAFDAFLNSRDDITLLFVDDGSSDDTPLVIERLRQRHPSQICTLRMSTNVGKGEAVRRGVQIALRRMPTFIGYWDADLATPLDEIPRFCELLVAKPQLSLVMGSRVALLGRQIKRRGLRHFLGRAFATAASIVLRLPVYDTQCGAKMFRVSPAVEQLFALPFGARWIFDVELLARMITSTGQSSSSPPVVEQIYEYPLHRWQDVAASRLKRKDFVLAARDLAVIYWRYMRRASKPTDVSPQSIEQSASRLQHRDAA